jgi:hypothetical protein
MDPDQLALVMAGTMLDLIRTPDQWCQGAPARHAEGHPVTTLDPKATRFDLEGAFRKAVAQWKDDDAAHVLRLELLACTGCGLAEFNDRPGTTHAAVLDVIRRAGETFRARVIAKGRVLRD